jgi:hypothetical protein
MTSINSATIDCAKSLFYIRPPHIDDRSHAAHYAGHIDHDRNTGHDTEVLRSSIVVRNLRACEQAPDWGIANVDARTAKQLPLDYCNLPPGRT